MSNEEKDLNLGQEEVEKAEGKAKKEKKVSPKKLTLNELKKENKVLDLRETVTIKVGESDYVIEYDRVFRKTKKQAVVEDMLEFFTSINKETEDRLALTQIYPMFLMVKHFTTLDIPEDLEEGLDMLQVLIDLDVLGQVMNVLPEKEVTDLFDLLTRSVEILNEEVDKTARENQEQQDKLRLVKDDDTE